MAQDASVLLSLLIFLAAGTLAFAGMAYVRVRGSVKRRTARIVDERVRQGDDKRSLRYSSLKAVTQLIEYTSKHYVGGNEENMRVVRQRMVQAGIYDPRGGCLLLRRAHRTGSPARDRRLHFLAGFLHPTSGTGGWLMALVGGIAGYIGPSMYIDKRISTRKDEHRRGFPDFMDLLVVCADSGLSMEASLERVGRELGESYPSLCTNIHMTNLEIRAGRNLKEALEHFGGRLALEEARAFATLINQSIDLGSSITDALRVYSDDMRHKRLSRAEEKAYALPAKLSLPMMVCIFPVLFVVILLPVYVKLHMGHYF